jgi:hypothetical protein
MGLKLQAERSEPRGMTLGDSTLLVAGCCLALALPGRVALAQTPTESLWQQVELAHEVLQRACLGLSIVVFVRRVRYGKPARSVQLLLLFCAMPLLETVVEDLLRGSDVMVVSPARLWWKRWSAMAGPAAFAAFALWRKRIPGWGSMLLMGLAVLSFVGGGIDFLVPLIAEFPAALVFGMEHWETTCLSLMVFSFGMIYGVPAAQSVWAGTHAAWTWADWTGVGLAATTMVFAICSTIPLILNQAVSFHGGEPAMIPAAIISFVLALTLSLVLAWRQHSTAPRELLSAPLT